MRKVEVDLGELIDAFENCRVGYEYYLDMVTGEIIRISDEWMEREEVDKIYEQMDEEPDRYLAIPVDSSRTGYRDMEEFVETVEDENLKEKLWIALNGKGAFRRFKDVLYNYPEERERWFKFKEERTKSRLAEWLKESEIEVVEERDD